MVLRSSGGHGRNVLPRVAARQKKIRMDDDQLRSLLDATVKGGSNRWFSQLHVRRFHDRKTAVLPEQGHDRQQQVVALGAARTVVDYNHADLVAGCQRGRDRHEVRPPNSGVER